MDADPIVVRLRTAGCVFAEDEASLLRAAAASEDVLEEMVARRVSGEPLELVLGWVDFAGVRVRLDPGVFVPRQRTVLLVEQAVALAPAAAWVADVCCGSGAIAFALSARRPDLRIVASDIDAAAVACATRNLTGRAEVYSGDLFEGLPADLRGRLGMATANVPYVPSGELDLLPREAREYEPRSTLDGGPDGLSVVGRAATAAVTWLAPGGSLLVEVAERQVEDASVRFADAGLSPDVRRDEESGTAVLVGTLA